MDEDEEDRSRPLLFRLLFIEFVLLLLLEGGGRNMFKETSCPAKCKDVDKAPSISSSGTRSGTLVPSVNHTARSSNVAFFSCSSTERVSFNILSRGLHDKECEEDEGVLENKSTCAWALLFMILECCGHTKTIEL